MNWIAVDNNEKSYDIKLACPVDQSCYFYETKIQSTAIVFKHHNLNYRKFYRLQLSDNVLRAKFARLDTAIQTRLTRPSWRKIGTHSKKKGKSDLENRNSSNSVPIHRRYMYCCLKKNEKTEITFTAIKDFVYSCSLKRSEIPNSIVHVFSWPRHFKHHSDCSMFFSEHLFSTVSVLSEGHKTYYMMFIKSQYSSDLFFFSVGTRLKWSLSKTISTFR